VKPKHTGDVIWEEMATPPDKVGQEVIADYVTRLPSQPGVYRMMDAVGDVLYVGKAKNLKNRVKNYASGEGHGGKRTARMIRETAAMEFVITRTETDALLLEANLIKRLRPRFNVLMRDDKSFPYILISNDHPPPACSSTGGRAREKASTTARLPTPMR
jgi:excinuclease ABC subunit C